METGWRTWILDAADAEALRQAFGSIGDDGHEWDDDPAAWVRDQRS
ncbi:MAG TPA: hypothetical protein VI357_28385 [Mycobacteriales bacterium]